MPRIRTIKPEFWADEKLSLLDPTTRLVFLGLISLADDAGRLVDNLKQLDGQLFPNTDDSCREALARLHEARRIVRYQSDSGQDLIQVTNWSRHQRVDKPNKHVLPGPPKTPKRQAEVPAADTPPLANDSGEPRESVATPSRDSRAPTTDHGAGTVDHGPTTNEADRGAGNGTHPAPASLRSDQIRFATLPTGIQDFVDRFYPVHGRRRKDVERQLVKLAMGERVQDRRVSVVAHGIDRLEAMCREVVDENLVRDLDKAIVVLFAKLIDTSDVSAAKVTTEQREIAADEQLGEQQRQLAIAWERANPDAARQLRTELADQYRGDSPFMAKTREWAFIAEAARLAEPIPAEQAPRPHDPEDR